MFSQVRCHEIITRYFTVTLILTILLQVSGCYTYRQIPMRVDPITGENNQDDMDQTLESFNGIKVMLLLRDGRTVTGVVLGYQASVLQIKAEKKDVWSGIVTKDTENIDKADIAAISHQELNPGNTIGSVFLVLLEGCS